MESVRLLLDSGPVSVWVFLAPGRFAAKTPIPGCWIILDFGGDFYRAHDTNLKATLRRSVRASEMEIHPGALLTSPLANRSRTYALPASTTALESNPKNRPRRTAVRDKPVRLATCLDRSVAASGAITEIVPWPIDRRRGQAVDRGRTLDRCPGHGRGQAPAAGGAPGAGRAAPVKMLRSRQFRLQGLPRAQRLLCRRVSK
jgi:hypothetical protein